MAVIDIVDVTPKYAYIGGQGLHALSYNDQLASPNTYQELLAGLDDSDLFEIYKVVFNARVYIRLLTGTLEDRSYTVHIKITNPDDLLENTGVITFHPVINAERSLTNRTVRAERTDIDHQKVVGVVNTDATYTDLALMQAYFDEYNIPYANIFEVDISAGGANTAASAYSVWVSALADHMAAIGAEGVVISPSMPRSISGLNTSFFASDGGTSNISISISSLCGSARAIKIVMDAEGYTEFDDTLGLSDADIARLGIRAGNMLSAQGAADTDYGRFAKTFVERNETTFLAQLANIEVGLERKVTINGASAADYSGTEGLGATEPQAFMSEDFVFNRDYQNGLWISVPNWRLAWLADASTSAPYPTVADIQALVVSADVKHKFEDCETFKAVIEMGDRASNWHAGVPLAYSEMLSELNFQSIVLGIEGGVTANLVDVASLIGQTSKYDPDPGTNSLIKFSFDKTLGSPDTASPTYRNFSADFTASTWVANAYNGETFPIEASFFVEAGFANMTHGNASYDFCDSSSPNQVIQPARGGILWSMTSFGNNTNSSWIKSGGCALIGTFNEPFTSGVLYPQPFSTRLFQGYCIATAAFASNSFKYGTLSPVEVTGDGLASPFSLQRRQQMTKKRENILVTIDGLDAFTGNVNALVGAGLNMAADETTLINFGNFTPQVYLDANDVETICLVGISERNTKFSLSLLHITFDTARSSLITDDTDINSWPSGLVMTLVGQLNTVVIDDTTVFKTKRQDTEGTLVVFDLELADTAAVGFVDAIVNPVESGFQTGGGRLIEDSGQSFAWTVDEFARTHAIIETAQFKGCVGSRNTSHGVTADPRVLAISEAFRNTQVGDSVTLTGFTGFTAGQDPNGTWSVIEKPAATSVIVDDGNTTTETFVDSPDTYETGERILFTAVVNANTATSLLCQGLSDAAAAGHLFTDAAPHKLGIGWRLYKMVELTTEWDGGGGSGGNTTVARTIDRVIERT